MTNPNFNYKDEQKPSYCKACKLKDMVNIMNKKCVICNLKEAFFNYPNEKQDYIAKIVNNVVWSISKITNVSHVI